MDSLNATFNTKSRKPEKMKQQDVRTQKINVSENAELVIPSDRKPYSAPCILSAEPLEAAATTCEAGGTLGKDVPIGCSALGS
jgi:hypothetical protein